MTALRSTPLALCALFALASCAAATGAPNPQDPFASQSLGASVGELPGALPSATSPSDHASTDTLARVVLDARRERALELYQRYLHGLVDDKLDALGALFDDLVSVTDGGSINARPRGALLREVARLHAQNGVSDIAPLVHGLRPVVRTYAELRRIGGTPPPNARSGDWIVEPPADSQLGYQTSGWVFRRATIRWVNDVPIIVGVQWEASRLR